MLESVLQIFPVHIREQTGQAVGQMDALEEIRIRVGQAVELLGAGRKCYLRQMSDSQMPQCREVLTDSRDEAYTATEEDMQELVIFLSRYSPYAFAEEIKNGYLTLEGGHRVGLAGQVRMEGNQVADISYIRFLNIRVATERQGCAKKLVPYLKRGEDIYNTLLFSPPGVGKSTYLRDCIRLLSEEGIRVGLVDERSEIAACYMGVPQNDVGCCTDVMDRCSKPAGIQMLLRSMAPKVLAVDELGSRADFEAVEQAFHCGCRILGTIHAGNLQELTEKRTLQKWIESGWFERYVQLGRDREGRRSFHVYNEGLEQLC